ncbi:putative epoxide hydrolase [Hyphomonas neptunium ATCC 15444]|uniref:Putative epoxide hydrolase n=2 Tax=Hyphomonas TaxID=85 RepID=Q0BZI5_HYPNA|nr:MULTISPECIES: alpha/beta hydrolase [Hyphomonas]ABI77894.1 putative epoxide hydrolase [Hyphomonas neptunium ATCC 15444]KCZ95197.1 putative epoxide hydrolase [Hyphomonas hirschiana VP5]
MSWPGVTQRRVATNGIELNIAEAGEGPLVLLLHGFPESWYSWRHQFAPLAAAGYHVVAPDMRGYGKSDKPPEITDYVQTEVIKDVIGLIPALGYDNAVVIGHDWGAPTAWSTALFHPDKVRAVGGLSVPFMPRSPVQPMPMLREIYKGQFFYQLYFQEPGVAEAEFEKDMHTALRKFLIMAAGETDLTTLAPKTEDDDLLTSLPYPETLPKWLTAADLDFYVSEFTASGMRGPINYYRNHDLHWQLTEGAPMEIHQPAMFIAGTADGVVMMAAAAIEAMPHFVKDLRINKMIPGIGHWTQQEAPEAVNETILEFLRNIDS